MEELIKKFQISDEELYFWSVHSGPELDLLWVSGSRKIGFEFKYADKPAMTLSIRSAIQSLKLDEVFMIYPGNRIMRLEEKVTAVGFDKLCDLKLN